MIKFLQYLFPAAPAPAVADETVHHMVRLTDEKPLCTIYEPNMTNVGFVHFAGGEENFKKPMCVDCGIVLDFLNGVETASEDPYPQAVRPGDSSLWQGGREANAEDSRTIRE